MRSINRHLHVPYGIGVCVGTGVGVDCGKGVGGIGVVVGTHQTTRVGVATGVLFDGVEVGVQMISLVGTHQTVWAGVATGVPFDGVEEQVISIIGVACGVEGNEHQKTDPSVLSFDWVLDTGIHVGWRVE